MSAKPIEYVQLTLKVPKACMQYLATITKEPKTWLENTLVATVKGEYEDRNFDIELAEKLNLASVFWRMFEDQQYNPDPNLRSQMKPVI
jgi:hypothetical protein